MDNLYTLTEDIRKKLCNEYDRLNENFHENEESTEILYEIEEFNEESEYEDGEFFEQENEYDIDSYEVDFLVNEYLEKETDNFENNVYLNLKNYIENSRYKNIIYLTILNDVYEFIKSNLLNNCKLKKYEIEILEKLEDHDTDDLLKKVNESDAFFLDLLTIFFEYNYNYTNQNKYENRKIIKTYDNTDCFKKFKIFFLDDIQYEYEKRRK